MPEFSDIVPLLLYFLSHLFRMLRLFLFAIGRNGSSISLVAVHCLTALPVSFVPFLLGEPLRLIGFSVAQKSVTSGGAIWLLERFLDCFAILVILIVGGGALNEFNTGMIFWLGLFLAVVMSGLLITRETIPFLISRQILVSRSHRGFVALRLFTQVQETSRVFEGCVKGRVAFLLTVSLAIWLCEFSAIWLLIDATLLREVVLNFFSNKIHEPAQLDTSLLVLTVLFVVGLFSAAAARRRT